MIENEPQNRGVEDLMELVECCICAKTFKDPRLLPCVHSFCLKCLQDTGMKSGKKPGDKMACPLCTVEFIIPQNGFSGLQKNHFVEKLMNLPGMKSLNPTAKRIDCDLCLEESDPKAETEISTAEIYCEDCHQSLCHDCFRQHNRFQGTKSHRISSIGQRDDVEAFFETHSQSACTHRGRCNVNIYCSDCKTVLCALCFVESHQLHKGADATKVADDFRKRMQEATTEINEKLSDVERKKSQVVRNEEEVSKEAELLECEIRQRFEELKVFGEQQMQELLSEVEGLRMKKLKEIEGMKLILDEHAADLDSTKALCDQLSSNESVVNVCQNVHALSEKFDEIKSIHQQHMLKEIDPFEATLKKTEFEALATSFIKNIVGRLELKELVLKSSVDEFERAIISCEDVTFKPYGEIVLDAQMQEECQKEHCIAEYETESRACDKLTGKSYGAYRVTEEPPKKKGFRTVKQF